MISNKGKGRKQDDKNIYNTINIIFGLLCNNIKTEICKNR